MNTKASMQSTAVPQAQKGGAGWGILAWLVGVPLPLILLVYLLKGCMGN